MNLQEDQEEIVFLVCLVEADEGIIRITQSGVHAGQKKPVRIMCLTAELPYHASGLERIPAPRITVRHTRSRLAAERCLDSRELFQRVGEHTFFDVAHS